MALSEQPSFEGLYDSIKQLQTEDLQMVILQCHTILMARKKRTTSYRAPVQAMGVFSAGLGGHLEKLFSLNLEKGDPLYGAVVVNSSAHMPSEGFFVAAKRHELIEETADEVRRTEFWQKEVQKVFALEVSCEVKELLNSLIEPQKRDLRALLTDGAAAH